MKTVYSIVATLCLLLLQQSSFAQNLPPGQPEQDACGALPLCGGLFTTTYSYTGYGAKLEQTQTQVGGACFDESNSVWLKVVVATAGNINFTITPALATNDYDFAVYNITGKTCDSINTGTRVRCDGCDIASSPGGLTGLSATGTGVYQAPGAGVNFLTSLPANAGDTYLILIDNFYQGPQSGFSIDFSSSTATFVGGAPPHFDSIAKACSYADSLHVYLTTNIKCPSLQTNGSDFVLSPAAATVVAARGNGCSGTNGYTTDLEVMFSNTLPPGTYYLKAKNGSDGNTLLDVCNVPMTVGDSIMFVIPQPLSVQPGPDTVTCIGNSIQLNAQIVGGNYPAYTYSWSPSTFLNSTTIANPLSTPTSTITYTVIATPTAMPACSVTNHVRVEVIPAITLSNNDTAICYGASVQLNAVGDSRYNFTWTPATELNNANIPDPLATPTTTRTYTVTASKAGCADQSKDVTITVQPGPTVYVGPDITMCYGDTLHMHPTITPDTFSSYTYSWTPPNAFNFANIKDPIYTATDTVTLTLTVTTPAGCRGTDDRIINVIPNNFITISNDTALCTGVTTQLHVSGGDLYHWTPAQFLSNDTIPDPIAFPLSTTLYTVYATNNTYGCRDTAQVLVTVYPTALVSLPDTVTLYPGDSYQINPGGNCLYFQWFPPAGLSNANIANPVAMPAVNTRYFVTATTEAGCATHDSIDINVSLESTIDMPNAFSPGSNPNPIFKPAHTGNVTLNYMRIFDRWGQQIFETNDINKGWDGTYNGKPQGLGVYIYVVEAKLPSGRIFRKEGNLTLLR